MSGMSTNSEDDNSSIEGLHEILILKIFAKDYVFQILQLALLF